jgi:Holliday junction resolvase RusA-like endonuclease
MQIQFFVAMENVPTVTHQEKAVRVVRGKPVFYEPAALKDARGKLQAELSRFVPERKFTGGVRLIVKWCFLRGRRAAGYRTTKPDLDNLQKLLKDVMTELGFWTDDALVCSEIAEKLWTDVPGIFIRIEDIL